MNTILALQNMPPENGAYDADGLAGPGPRSSISSYAHICEGNTDT
ncbi:hypothetical protein OHS33_31785 [Streptomyces sp. NBC_00536]|nr:hypothetical protein [Streptomyces sp. NBC_00536]WUC82537.1 hypothetical protein OHS33_31785 [Streptomyces sp. NBC_00536]